MVSPVHSLPPDSSLQSSKQLHRQHTEVKYTQRMQEIESLEVLWCGSSRIQRELALSRAGKLQRK